MCLVKLQKPKCTLALICPTSMRGRGKHAYGVRSADMYPGTAHCQLCMHTSYRSAHQLLRNAVNSSTDPAEFISHSASAMFELDRQSEFQYSTRSSIWPISESPYKLTILTRIRSIVLDIPRQTDYRVLHMEHVPRYLVRVNAAPAPRATGNLTACMQPQSQMISFIDSEF